MTKFNKILIVGTSIAIALIFLVLRKPVGSVLPEGGLLQDESGVLSPSPRNSETLGDRITTGTSLNPRFGYKMDEDIESIKSEADPDEQLLLIDRAIQLYGSLDSVLVEELIASYVEEPMATTFRGRLAISSINSNPDLFYRVLGDTVPGNERSTLIRTAILNFDAERGKGFIKNLVEKGFPEDVSAIALEIARFPNSLGRYSDADLLDLISTVNDREIAGAVVESLAWRRKGSDISDFTQLTAVVPKEFQQQFGESILNNYISENPSQNLPKVLGFSDLPSEVSRDLIGDYINTHGKSEAPKMISNIGDSLEAGDRKLLFSKYAEAWVDRSGLLASKIVHEIDSGDLRDYVYKALANLAAKEGDHGGARGWTSEINNPDLK